MAKFVRTVLNGIAYKVEKGDLYYLDTLDNKYYMITYFEAFEKDELHFLRKTLPKFNEYWGQYL